LLMKMMAKDPKRRPESMNDVLKSLETTRIYRVRPKKPPVGEDAA